MMVRPLHLLLLVAAMAFVHKTCAGQQGLLHGRVVEAGTDRPLPGTHVQVVGSRQVTMCDSSGRFTVRREQRSNLVIRLSHVGYAPVEFHIGLKEGTGEAPLLLQLEPRVEQIPEVTIRNTTGRAPEPVYQRDDLHVGDHRVNTDGVWVLAYAQPQLWHREERAGEQLFREARLVVLDTLFREVATAYLAGPVRGLHCDHQRRVIVEGATVAWVASVSNGVITLQPIERETLHNAVLPWTDSIPGLLLGNDRDPAWPAFRHVAFDPQAGSTRAICSVEDRHVMELFRSQYKYMSGRDKVIAMDLEIETGVDREVIAGYMTGFHHDPYFRVPYAPLFVVRDTLCVFDHASERIRRFTTQFTPLTDVPFRYTRERGWRKRLLQDPVDGRIFAQFARASTTELRVVDPHTGALGPATMLYHPFPEEVQVFEGFAYYLYRVAGSTQRRALYREPLK